MATVMAGIQVLPNGKDMNTGGILPEIVEVIKNSDLKYEVCSMETVVEGNMREVMELVIQLQAEAMKQESEEVFTNIKLHYRPDGITLEDKHS